MLESDPRQLMKTVLSKIDILLLGDKKNPDFSFHTTLCMNICVYNNEMEF